MFVCVCKGVSDKKIRALVESGCARSLREVVTQCRAGSDCGSCLLQIRQIVEETQREADASAPLAHVSGEGV
jgi:bacterioferritin-associated ferredoxin